MAIETQQPQGKILFKRTDIVTMKKDIKMLRELDARKEGEKILAPKTTVAPAQPVLQPKSTNIPIEEKVVEQIHQQDQEKMAKARPYASEAEKQQIFTLETQIADIKKQLQSLGTQEQPSLNLKKNQVLLQQEQQKKQLDELIKEEEKIGKEIAVVEKAESTITVPTERSHLERERAAMENKRQETEKKRWAAEQDLSKLNDQMKGLEANYQGFGDQETALKEKIAKINDSLRAIYAEIIQRENSKPKAVPTLTPEPKSTPAKIVSSAFVPPKRDDGAAKENEQRKKFMEDIEAWANSSDKKS